jgi:hypothetical protein
MLSPLGRGLELSWRRLLEGASGVVPIGDQYIPASQRATLPTSVPAAP